MTDQPVTPDREALIKRAQAFFRMDIARGLVLEDDMDRFVDDLLPLLTDALDRARQQGRDDAAATITGEANSEEHGLTAYWMHHCAALARGADRKAAPAPWDTALDVDPFTGQPDHIHGDSCDAEECCE